LRGDSGVGARPHPRKDMDTIQYIRETPKKEIPNRPGALAAHMKYPSFLLLDYIPSQTGTEQSNLHWL
jgi:hypothetical protein